ncbi:hypothetical protein KFE94_00810 [bacterium SCSIO 12643]|nr:hypothetical protein KFE94_00810 [bacterium SCSIO 12643]
MKNLILIVLLQANLLGFSQDEFPNDTIESFNLKLVSDHHLSVSTMITTIDSIGNVRCTFYTSNFKKARRDTIADKQIILDHNSFRQIKEQIIAFKLADLPHEKDDPYTMDGKSSELLLSFNGNQIRLKGNNRENCDPIFKNLLELLREVVGYMAYDYENY